MGADMWMFVEHKDLDTNKWNLVKTQIGEITWFQSIGILACFTFYVDIIIKMVSMNFQ